MIYWVSILSFVLAAPPSFDADALVGRWVAMWNSYDLDEVDELFVTDGRVTYFSSEKQGVVRGIEAVREHHRGFGFVSGGRAADNALWIDAVRTDVFGESAVVTAIWHFGDEADKTQAQRGPMTMVYVAVGDDYRLAHLHFATYRE